MTVNADRGAACETCERRRRLTTTDASVWAEEFCRLFNGYVVSDVPLEGINIDFGLMVGWFANAIEMGRGAGQGGEQ